MAWLKTLADTYDTYVNLAGNEKHAQAVLLPISHSTFNAQIEVVIDLNGNFRQADKVKKEGEENDVVTIIPVTEDSASRSSGIAPHPLCDKLCYIAGDYTAYTGDDKEIYHVAYMEQLREWAESEHSHIIVKAVYQYLAKGTLIQDLVGSEVLELDAKGQLTDDVKIHNLGQTGANVRFIVHGDDKRFEVWKEQELYQKYCTYYQKKTGEKKLCYATGQTEACSDKHPSKIRNSGDKAKLISGNDETGFTYRGRFTDKDQAVTVGYDTSQKAHNALRWLIQKQGYTRDESAIVCWAVNKDIPIPDPTKDSVNACNDVDEFDQIYSEIEEVEADRHDTGKYFAVKFRNAVNGYVDRFKIDDDIKVAIIALDAATTGRLSVVYYEEMKGRQYINAILNWQQHCKWRRTVRLEKPRGEKKTITCECTPSPRDMALAAFGVQRSEWLEGDSKLLRTTVKRLLPCITHPGVKIPVDIIKAAARRASMPQAMSEYVWYNDMLCVVCAMIRYNYEEGEKTMENFLEDKINDRNVLFGRLLAVYDYKEQRAMLEFDENGKVMEQRTTNARRYWNAYSRRPAKTAKVIEENLKAYEKRLKGYQLMKFEEWEAEIMTHMSGECFDNRALTEDYLPAYYQQMDYMRKSWKKKEE